VRTIGIFLAGAVLSAALLLAAGCGSSSSSSADMDALQHQADVNAIDLIEKTWHKAVTTKDVDLMMTVWAPDATFTVGGEPYVGDAQIRKFFETSGAFQPENHWVSDTPAYKIRITANGDKGTLYFECHSIDTATGKLANIVAADQDVQKIDGKWLITTSSAAPTTLKS
jgi:uncharacterized protein (TIGR02246 family)